MSGISVCPFCGKEVNPEAVKCVWCKEYLYETEKEKGPRSFLKTALFCQLLGGFSVHRFYTGYIGVGIAQILTFGGLGFWTLIDLVSILSGNYKDKEGIPLSMENKSNTIIAGALALASTLLIAAGALILLFLPMNSFKQNEIQNMYIKTICAFLSPITMGFISIVGNSGKKLGIISIATSLILICYLFMHFPKF